MGMLVEGTFSKLVGINNCQARAISLETGPRNPPLAIAITLLTRDYMGDFYSSMFFTTGLFGLCMYAARLLSSADLMMILNVLFPLGVELRF